MAEYWKTRPSIIAASRPSVNGKTTSKAPRALSEFDKLREALLSNDAEEGWASELRRYLSTMQWDVDKDTDIVEWWQVRDLKYQSCCLLIILPAEPRRTLSNACSYRPRRPCISSLICALRAGVLGYETNRN